jgi:hypothetical protein
MCSRERRLKLWEGVTKRVSLLKLRSTLCVRFWYHSTQQTPQCKAQRDDVNVIVHVEPSEIVDIFWEMWSSCRVCLYQISKLLLTSDLPGHEPRTGSHSSPYGISGGLCHGQIFVSVLQFSPVSIIPPMLHIHIPFVSPALYNPENWHV